MKKTVIDSKDNLQNNFNILFYVLKDVCNLSTEEITSICQCSKNTLNNWIDNKHQMQISKIEEVSYNVHNYIIKQFSDNISEIIKI
jgi:hypothetical protein